MKQSHLLKHLLVLAVSIGAAIILSRLGVFDRVLELSGSMRIVGIFIAGFFYTSVLTIAPAAVVLAELSAHSSPWIVAGLGAVAACLGDFILLSIVRREERDVEEVLRHYHLSRVRRFAHLPLVRFGLGIAGFLVIASPLPDELGLALMGASGVRPGIFIGLSYLANFTGILALSAVVHSLI